MLPQDPSQTTAYQLGPTQKQIVYARSLAIKTQVTLPWETLQSRKDLSLWIDARLQEVRNGHMSDLPSSRQVAFAERIARIKRTQVPEICFKSRASMSLWLDRYADRSA